MTGIQRLEDLIAALGQAVEAGLAYFSGPGAESTVRIGEWGPREVLSHMIIWHQSSVEGMESVLAGGPPLRLLGGTDELNARAVEATEGQTMARIIGQIRHLQARLLAAVRALPDPSVTVLISANGLDSSALHRLEILANHWNEHLAELEAAPPANAVGS